MGKSGRAPNRRGKAPEASSGTTDPRKRRLIRFVITFLGILIVGAILYPYLSIALDEELRGFMAVTAGVCGGLLDVVSSDVSVSDRFLTFHGFSVEIIEECTGIFEMLIFLAALMSYPASWRSRAVGFALGLPALYLFNVLRIIFLTAVGVYYHNFFEFMHLYFWQATLILMITSVWVMWILLVVSREKKTTAFLA